MLLIVCTFPVEYCEFGSSLTRCKEWLKEENQELYAKYYSDGMNQSLQRYFLTFLRPSEALQAKMGMLTVDAQTKLEKETAKKEAKAEAKAEAALKKKMASQVSLSLYSRSVWTYHLSQVTIKRIERAKRKHVTSIHGLEAFDIDLKKAAKQLAGRFATGASVTKNAQGQDEIVVQGDVAGEVVEMIEKGEGILKGVPEGNVEIVEEKKKKE